MTFVVGVVDIIVVVADFIAWRTQLATWV